MKKKKKDLSKRFANTCKLCNKDINKFCLISRKRVYSYQYMGV